MSGLTIVGTTSFAFLTEKLASSLRGLIPLHDSRVDCLVDDFSIGHHSRTVTGLGLIRTILAIARAKSVPMDRCVVVTLPSLRCQGIFTPQQQTTPGNYG